ncbi:rRNA processing/ribosome biogenesis-domain-containing protein [Xylariales sp. AK1849]|nr:rRNA processing/ribosome biogenesis-domain-containing protein [Xylariales sp. AK1849]
MSSSFVTLPPELRSLCRKLTSTKAEQLPRLIPVLLQDVQRCQGPLSAPQESKSSANSSEASVLVHKLRTQISALLNGRSVEGRFAAVALVKAFVETGGWECLRASEPWVRGLLSILQKRDPVVSKELCVVTLTKIYTMVQKYQTLVREIATPTLPTFATACLQALKPAASSKAIKLPLSFNETIFEALSILIPLYPTTLRPFGTQIRSATKPYLVPTTSDNILVLESLQRSSRRLVIRLHMTAAKSGGSDEWAKHISGLIKEFHETADQVFRAIQENWESTSGYIRQQVDLDAEPHGAGGPLEHFPQWTGIQAGSERMVGLLGYIADCLRCATKVAVTIPVSAITDLTARVSSIMPPIPGKEKNESVQMNPAAGREEKDELWTVFPGVQIATVQLILAVAERLGRNYSPLAQETLDQALRMFDFGYRLPELRTVTFALTTEMLQLRGPTLTKNSVDALTLVIKSCCRDLLGAAGRLKVTMQQTSILQNGSKSKTASQNADSFLSSNAEEETLSVNLDPEHIAAAEQLLVTLFSHLPQQQINSSLRSRMLRTAILCNNKAAQIASVLHPSRDRNGRTPQVILPYLQRQFPDDEDVEILRFNFRPMATGFRGDFMDLDDDMNVEDEAPAEKPTNGLAFDRPFEATFTNSQQHLLVEQTFTNTAVQASAPIAPAEVQPSPFMQGQLNTVVNEAEPPLPHALVNPLKRKTDEAETIVSKRVGIDGAGTSVTDPELGSVAALVDASLERSPQVDEDDSDDESVHLNMDLDSDEGDEEEE